MEALFLRLVSLSITASYMIAAVMLLRVILRKAPHWIICALWGLVALRLVCPVSLESRASLIPAVTPLTTESLYEGTTTPRHEEPENDAAADARAENTPQKPSAVYPLSLLWTAGAAGILLYGLASYLLLRRRLATAVCFRDGLWQSEAVSTPFVLGFFRPHIYLPFDIDLITAKYVVAHERAHIRRRDHLIKPLGYVLLAVYWFNPFVWAAYILLCRDIELACDERVVKRLSENGRRNYALALLSCGMKRRLLPACPLTFAEVGVKERIKNVMTYRKPTFWLIVTSILVCAIAALCFLTNPVSAAEGDRAQVSATMEPAPTPTATPEPTEPPKATASPAPTKPPAEDETDKADEARDETDTDRDVSANTASRSSGTAANNNTSSSTSSSRSSTASVASTKPPDPEGIDLGTVIVCGTTEAPEESDNPVGVGGTKLELPESSEWEQYSVTPEGWIVVGCGGPAFPDD